MIEVLYNDTFNDLSFIHIVDKETLAIVDSDMYVYGSLCYNPFEPSNSDIVDMWRRATQKYYRIGDEELALKDWRHNQKEQSDDNFIVWLADDAKKRNDGRKVYIVSDSKLDKVIGIANDEDELEEIINDYLHEIIPTDMSDNGVHTDILQNDYRDEYINVKEVE